MPRMSEGERRHYREGELGPGVPERRVSSLPKVEGPQVWELSAHPHEAERAGKHIDLRLGDPATGIAHSFVLPKRTELPGPGEKALAVPTYDHTLDYMDYVGPISTDYGKGVVLKGRRAKTEVYHAEPDDPKKTLVRFNLYDGPQPEEFAIVRAGKGALLVNKTQTREGRPDVPSDKPTYGEVPIDKVDPTNDQQMMMPKLDGAHAIIDLKAGRSPRVYSYRVGKKSKTGLIEHTHKMPDLLKDKVPKELDGTILRGEVVALRKSSGVDIRELTTPVEKAAGLMLEYRHFAPTAAKRMEERGTRPRLRKTHRMYGAFDADKLVGMIRVNTDPLKEWERDVNYYRVKALDPEVSISGLTVDPKQRRRGIGTDLRRFAQMKHPKGIVTGIGSRSEQETMRRLNEKMGFVKFWQGKNRNEQFYWGPKMGAVPPTVRDVIPAEQIGGLLNSKVWESRAKQKDMGVRLQAFPFDVVKYKGKDMSAAPFGEKLKVLKEIEEKIADLWIPEIAATPEEKIDLLNKVKSKQHPLTEEGVVLVEPGRATRPIKAKVTPDFDVYVRDVHAAKSGKTGELHDRAGSISYSWTPDGPVVGQLGGFKHDEGREMLRNPDKYIGRVAKVHAMRVFPGKDGEMGALFQPRFREWHLDKGEIEKTAKLGPGSGALIGGGLSGSLGALLGYAKPTTWSGDEIKNPTKADRRASAIRNALALGATGALGGAVIGQAAKAGREAIKAEREFWKSLDDLGSSTRSYSYSSGSSGSRSYTRSNSAYERAKKAADDAEREWQEWQKGFNARSEARRKAREEGRRRAEEEARRSRARGGAYERQQKGKEQSWDDFWDDFNKRWEGYGRAGGGGGGRAGGYGGSRHGKGSWSTSAGTTPDWLKDVKTKAEAKTKYRDQVKKHHPDWGGNEETMKRVNAEWDSFEKSYAYSKLASVKRVLGRCPHPQEMFRASFIDEMSKIAGLEGRVLSQLLRSKVNPPVSEAISDLEDQARAKWKSYIV